MTEASELERVYREDGGRLWRALVGYSGDPEIASDAMAEAFSQALAGSERIVSPAAWVWRAAFKIAAGELQRRQRSGGELPDRPYGIPEPVITCSTRSAASRRTSGSPSSSTTTETGRSRRSPTRCTSLARPSTSTSARPVEGSDRCWRSRMSDNRRTLRLLDRLEPPELWPEIRRRADRPSALEALGSGEPVISPHGSSARRLLVGAVALLVAVAGLGLAAVAFQGASRTPGGGIDHAQIVLSAPPGTSDADLVTARDVIDARLRSTGIASTVSLQDQTIAVTLPAESLEGPERDEILQLVSGSGLFELREVRQVLTVDDPSYGSIQATCTPGDSACEEANVKDNQAVFLDRQGNKYVLGPVGLANDAIASARAIVQQGPGVSGPDATSSVLLHLTSAGLDQLANLTGRLVGDQLAVVLDEQVLSAPTVQSAISSGDLQVVGDLTAARAETLAAILDASPLPIPLSVVEARSASPSPGTVTLCLEPPIVQSPSSSPLPAPTSKNVKSLLLNALAAAKTLYADCGNYTAAQPQFLARIDPPTTFDAATTASVGIVSVRDVAPTHVLFVSEDSEGTAWCVGDNVTATTRFGQVDAQTVEDCTGGWGKGGIDLGEPVFHGRTNDCFWILYSQVHPNHGGLMTLMSSDGKVLGQLLWGPFPQPALNLRSFTCTEPTPAVLVFGYATPAVADVNWTSPTGSDHGPPDCVASNLPDGFCLVIEDFTGGGEAVAYDAAGNEIGRATFGGQAGR